MVRSIYRVRTSEGPKLVADFKLFKIKADRRGQGTALSVTSRALKNLAAAGVSRVEILAGRHSDPGRPDNKWTGYLVWPKFGFDGRLFEQHFDGFPDEIVHHFSGAESLQKLFNRSGGPVAWEAFGPTSASRSICSPNPRIGPI